ncbi:MAG: hypothetical protein RLZZ522_508 [Verrucomicrobiota bacterium]|jgi:phosphate-selective porin
MKSRLCLVLLAAFAACSCLAAAKPADKPATTDADAIKQGKKKKKKNKNKDKTDTAKTKGKAKIDDAKDVIAPPTPEPKERTNVSFCEFLAEKPGQFYVNAENPWLQSFTLGGRFHYQAISVDGNDMYGRHFHDNYDEYRRFRLETRTKFLRYFTAEMDVNMVSDNRYRDPPDNLLQWGYDDFDTAIIDCDLLKAFHTGMFDELSIAYGKMKMPISEEQRQSSKAIYTIERSMLSSKLAGEESRPTGILLDASKGDWRGRLGCFSGEDDADFLAAWNDGFTQFYSLTWQPRDDFHLALDYSTTHRSGTDDALGYQSAVALGSTYQTKRWGVQASLVYGDNGYGDPTDSAKNRANRQGDFYGAGIMPWYWLVEDQLQLVCRYDYARAEESEGLQLSSRYLRGHHDDPLVDDKNGRGDLYNSWYLGLNYYLCGDNAKIMAGVQFEDMASRDLRKVERPKKQGGDYYVTDYGDLKAFTYVIGFRTAF